MQEADQKGGKEEVHTMSSSLDLNIDVPQADLRGLTALLFDDGKRRVFLLFERLTRRSRPDLPDVPEENDIQRALGAIGVKYSHRNDDVLLPSRIEEERSRNALKVQLTFGMARSERSICIRSINDAKPPQENPRTLEHKPTLNGPSRRK